MIDPTKILETQQQHLASIHLTIPRAQIQTVMGPGLKEVREVIAAQGVTPTGPWLTHHFRMAPDAFDFEIAVPVASPVTPAGRVKPSTLPAMTVARTTYRGGYEGLGEGWGAFIAALQKSGHELADDLWEVYVAGPETGSAGSTYQTELNKPLRR